MGPFFSYYFFFFSHQNIRVELKVMHRHTGIDSQLHTLLTVRRTFAA